MAPWRGECPMTQSSPGGWVPPPGVLPGWNWLPPDHGVRPDLGRVPLWVRAWHRTPLIDRYAHVWMWRHGGLEILPSQQGPADPAGDREPLRPRPRNSDGAADRTDRGRAR
ncbi:protein of unknown function [Modestobacter italicus]|uniref:Uncharacterized protein n=1 Tax=Modestobacter italicus (strain DSM 44449 / CECT 9708 / BC 501) TaxID=2732864 RepID=I4F0N5_MODI5|nr:protein of unknown function [Modestobacter marinus]